MVDMKITKDNAIAVSQLEDEKIQEKVLKKVINLDLSSKRTEEIVDYEMHKLAVGENETGNSTGLDAKCEISENNENTEINIQIKK